jgi:hypothetical protein
MQLMLGFAAQIKTLTAKSLAAALCLSISGAYCLFCCQAMSGAQTVPDSCPLAKTSHCNSSKNKEAKSGAPAAKGVDGFECCALKFNFFVATLEEAKQPQSADAAVSTPNSLVLSRLKTYAARRELPARIYRPPDFDGRGQRLKNCLLRI